MKLALNFLLAFVVATSYQQFPFSHHPATWWLSPYARSSGPEHRGFYEDDVDLTDYSSPYQVHLADDHQQDDETSSSDSYIEPSQLRQSDDDDGGANYDSDHWTAASVDDTDSRNEPNKPSSLYSPYNARYFLLPGDDFLRPADYSPEEEDEPEGFYMETPEERELINSYYANQEIEARKRPPFRNFGKVSRPSLKVRPIAKNPPLTIKRPKIPKRQRVKIQNSAKFRPAVKIQPVRKFRPAVMANKNNRLPVENRFFNLFGGHKIVLSSSSTAFRLPFGKTTGILVTASVNLTSVVSCVASSEFITANPTACRRRRRGVERLLSFDDQQQDDSVSPSNVEKLETTAQPQQIYEERNARLHELLASSKDDLIVDEDEDNRDKRSFFFAATTTLTSYTFFNTTITKTVRLLTAGTTSGLTCLPCNFSVC